MKANPALTTMRRAKFIGNQPVGDPRKANIWIVHTFDHRRVVLLSDLDLDHFYFTEGDPAVTSADYDPPAHRTVLDGDTFEIKFDALVQFEDGTTQCRHVRQDPLKSAGAEGCRLLSACQTAAGALGAKYREVSAANLDSAQQRIRNWSRLLAAYRRCQHRSLAILEHVLLARLRHERETTVDELLLALSEESPAIVLGTLASLLRQRLACADLDTQTWSRSTNVRRRTP